MEVDISPGIVHNTALQLQQRNALTSGFVDVVADYQNLLRRCKESKVHFLVNSHPEKCYCARQLSLSSVMKSCALVIADPQCTT